MKKKFSVLFSVSVIASLFLSGCFGAYASPLNSPQAAGQVIGLQPQSTLYGLQQVMKNNTPGLGLMVKDNMYLFRWILPDSQTVGFVAIKSGTTGSPSAVDIYRQVGEGLTGNVSSSETWLMLKQYLLSKGWKELDPSQLPPAIRIGIVTSTAAYQGVMVPIFAVGTSIYYLNQMSEQMLNDAVYPRQLQ
jgi:hypothetical protein